MDTLYEWIYSGLQMIEQLFACFICGAYLYANLLTLHFQIEENHVVEIQVVLFWLLVIALLEENKHVV